MVDLQNSTLPNIGMLASQKSQKKNLIRLARTGSLLIG